MVICDMEVSRVHNIIYVYPQGHFSSKNKNICLFDTVKETALTVIVKLLDGWPQGHLWPKFVKRVKTSFMDTPYGDLFKQKCEGVNL